MKDCYIYCLKCPYTNEIRYIGQTVKKLSLRLSSHISDAKKGKTYHNANWIRQLLKDNKKPIIESIERVDKSKLDEREIFWIKYYKNNDYNLTNETKGGFGHNGYKQSLETREKRSKSMKLLAERGFYNNIERSKKLSNYNRNKKISEETKIKISNTLSGRILPESIKSQLRGSKVKSRNIKTGEVEIFNCLSDAARELNINKGPISNVLKGRQKTAYGRVWYKVEDIVES